jgi:hypothetical protein
MFIDGFAGNIDVNLTSGTITNDSQGNPVKINVTAAGGLGRPSITGDGTYIRPQVPCFFVHRGVTYEVSFIGEWNPTLGKGSLNLNPLRPGGIGSVTPITTNIATGFKTGGGTLTVPVRFSTPTQTGGLSANGTAVINNSGNVTSVTVSFPGSGYSNGAYTNATEGCPTIIIGGARLTWIRDNGGGITGYSIIDAGTGYAVNTIINFPNTSGGVATAYVSSVDANGGITGVTISSPGTGYTEDPVVTFGDNLLYNLTVKPGFTVTSGHPLPSSVTLITAGNRSMLANDFTQMNDLGYGIFCTNGGLVENVSMFTYYCHSAYYSLNGGQCRSIAGSTSYGVNGLKSEGSDPNEVPIAIRNKRAMTQKVSVYSQGDYINAIDDFSIYVTLDTGGYAPLAQSQIEINHYGVVKNYNVQSAILVDDPAVPANTYALTVDDGTGQGLIAAVPDAWPAIIRIYFVQELLDINKDTLSRPSTVLSFYEDPTNVYNILAYTQTGADSATAESDEPYNYILLEPYTESGLFRQGLGRFTVTGGGTGFNTNTNYTATIPAPSTAGTATVNGNQTNTDLVTISSPANTILPGSRVTLTAGGGDPSGIVGANTYVLWVNSAKTQIRVSRKTSWTNGAGLTFSGTQAVGYARCNNLSGTIDQLVLTNQGAGYDGTSVRTITVAGGTSPATITAYPVGVVGSNKIKVIDISPADRARIVAGLAATTPYYYYFVWEGVTYKVTGYSGATQTGNEWGEVTVETIAGAAIQAPVISSTLKAGVGANTQGDVTVRISTMRVTGHDMLNVGTGGYADSKYPNDLYGPPINPPDSGLETKELRKGRVYYATTDQDGNFKVGKSFSVDQGRGTVSISAPISLTNVDGISFKRGQTLVQQFTVDGTMGGNSNNSVPTERAIITYVNNRLGLNKNNNQSGVTKIGSGFMDLIGFQSMNGPIKSKIIVPTDSGVYWVGTATNFYNEMHAVRFFGTATTALTWNSSRSVTFTGDVTGTFSINGGADVTGVTMTIQPNSVALGTDTSGDYVATGATTGFGISGSTSGENQTFTVNSNATSTNTANTIVHRDGNGDFTTRNINATFVDATLVDADIVASNVTATTITHSGTDGTGDIGQSGNKFGTVYATTINATTFNGALSGAATKTTNTLTVGTHLSFASGTGFDGSADRQIVTNATSTYAINTIISRDNTGAFAAGSFFLGDHSGSDSRTANTNLNYSRLFVKPSYDTNASGTISAPDALAFNNFINGVSPISNYTQMPFVMTHATTTATGIMVLPNDVLRAAAGRENHGVVFLTASNDAGTVIEYLKVGSVAQESESPSINLDQRAGVVIRSTSTGILSTKAASNTYTGALIVQGGVGIGGDVHLAETRGVNVNRPGMNADGTLAGYANNFLKGFAGGDSLPSQYWPMAVSNKDYPKSGLGMFSNYALSDIVGLPGPTSVFISAVNTSTGRISSYVAAGWGDQGEGVHLKGTQLFVDTNYIAGTATGTPAYNDCAAEFDQSVGVGGSIFVNGIIYGGDNTLGPLVPSIRKSTTNGNGVGDIGQTDNRFGTIWGTASSALYADLAERYKADANYDPGTVVSFGGAEEITVAREFMDRRIAGVISTNPAYLMNDREGAGLAVALQGRVPCKVVGKIRKGDMLVASGMVPGVATAEEHPALGSVIGKALENYDSQTIGLIEVVVGRI